jgi:GrpB-like predicted nucleotidyltransferase (UPF0157 family)
MDNSGMLVSDVLSGYLNGKPIDRGVWQSLDEQSRARLAHAIVATKPKTVTEVRVCDYDPEWPRLFSQIERELREQVGALALAIEHVGSTSVPGLAAKPIIDIEFVIASAYQFPSVKEGLENFGYIHRGPCGVPDREVFRCVIDLPPHHLYVCEAGARPLKEHLCFRDALRQNPQLAAEYAALKRALAEQHQYARDAYTEAKTSFIRSVITSPFRVVG